MKTCVLWIDYNATPSRECITSLEAAGFGVLKACNELQAVELLKLHRVDVVCVASPDGHAEEIDMGRGIWKIPSNVPVVLVHQGAIPAHFEEYADIVIDEPDFRAMALWIVQALRDAPNLFFVRWFVNWMRRPNELLKAEGRFPDFCNTSN